MQCTAQNSSILVKKELISDVSNTPVYKRLATEEDGKTVWRDEYKYMDSIQMYSITYLSDGLKVNGFLVEPKANGKHPAIIFNRGGNRDFGALTIGHAAILMGQLAKEGYVVIASQYRGNAGGEGIEEFGGADVNDVLILPTVLNELNSVDTSRIGMYGWSRGGMMTYIALSQTDKIKAAAVGGAVSDCFKSLEDRPQFESGVYAELVPDYYKNREAELTKRSAVKWADRFKKDVPILMLHGNADWRVKPEQSLSLAMEFEKERIPYRLIIFEGGDHALSEHKPEVNAQVLSWFNRYLKNGEKTPNMEYHGK
jgi:dipeptidyl aminopeptidase/acylaminoacyl peptidase